SINSTYNGGDSYETARVEQVYFGYGSARVAPIDRKNLRELARSLTRQSDDYRLTVVGHASRSVAGVRDPLRRKIINFRMAQKRADAVAHTLVEAGASPDWVEARSAGAAQPSQHPDGRSQQAADQRADVFLDAN
ncbi:MAG: OmpA family protein, partial [Alphaproteobacteria bacterium]|nr:OmpA family protein [Alphaproteobacteria bacterium]